VEGFRRGVLRCCALFVKAVNDFIVGQSLHAHELFVLLTPESSYFTSSAAVGRMTQLPASYGGLVEGTVSVGVRLGVALRD